MNKLKFVAINYWNKKEMDKSDSPTPEQWAFVEKIADDLTKKYAANDGCVFHPDKVQKFIVSLFNGFVEIQIVPDDTCNCEKIMEEMTAIRNYESILMNPGGYPKEEH